MKPYGLQIVALEVKRTNYIKRTTFFIPCGAQAEETHVVSRDELSSPVIQEVTRKKLGRIHCILRQNLPTVLALLHNFTFYT